MTYSQFDNVMPLERIARLVVGSVLIAVVFYPDVTAYWLALLAVYPIITAIIAWDPLYAMVNNLKAHMPAKRPIFTHAPA